MLLLFVVLYLLLTVVIGFWASRRVTTSGDYMLAGRSLPMMLSVSALFATWFGSETVFGASSEFLQGGLYAVIEDPFGAALCLLLFGVFFARKLYGMNLLTLGDFFRVRFGRSTELLASLLMVPSYFGYTAGQLVAMGVILQTVTGMALYQGVIVSALIVTVYTYVGGMWAISITDFIQSVIIVGGLLVVSVVLTQKCGGVSEVLNSVPASTYKFLPSLNWKDIMTYVAAWSVLGLGSIPSQDVFQRVMSSGSKRVAEYSCYYAALLYLTIAMLPLFISLCVKHLYGNEIEGDTQLALPNMVLLHMSLPVQIVFFGSLLSAIMSTASASILAPAAILSENMVKPLLVHNPTDEKLLMITRVSVILFSAGATVMACLNTNIYELVGESSVLSLVSLFVPLAAGLYWRRATAGGAIAAMISGMIAWAIWEFLIPSEIPSLVPAVLVSTAGMLFGSLIFKRNQVFI